MSQQLVKKGTNGKMVHVNPKSWIEAIKDKNTGQTLVEILQGFNMYFLPYNGNTSSTRCLVPTMLRKKGLWITYVKYDGNVHTEWYAANEIDDKSWGDSSNWRIGNNTIVGDITISANGNWVVNGKETTFKAIGEKGNTPILRVINNKLQVSYNLGDNYINVTDNYVYTKFRVYGNKLQSSIDLGSTWTDTSDYIASWFRWQATSGDSQVNNVGKIQISRDGGNTWTDMSNNFINNLHISRYIGINEALPTSGIAEGTIYAKGPYYAEGDTLNNNPIYRLWVYAWKGDTLAWQDNGEFTSISAGIVQETGDSETEVMSQKAVTEELLDLSEGIDRLNNDYYKNNIESETPIVLTFEDNKYYSYINNTIKENSNYKLATVDATSYRNKILHLKTLVVGSACGIVFHDGENIINYYFLEENEGRDIDKAVIVPESTVTIYINYYKYKTGEGRAWIINKNIDVRNLKYNIYDIIDNNLAKIVATDIIQPEIMLGKRFNTSGEILELDSMALYKYDNINEGDYYSINYYRPNNYSNAMIAWLDYAGFLIKTEYKGEGEESLDYKELKVKAPLGAKTLLFNTFINHEGRYSVKNTNKSYDIIADLNKDINNLKDSITSLVEIEKSEILENQRVKDGVILDLASMSVFIYPVIAGETVYISAYYPSTYGTSALNLFDSEGVYKGKDFTFDTGEVTEYIEEPYVIPEGVSYIYLNTVNTYSDKFHIERKGDIIKSRDLKKNIREIEKDVDSLKNKFLDSSNMKVHIYSLSPNRNINMFHIRTVYNENKDIILLYKANDNTCIRPDSIYVGNNALADDDLMVANNIVCGCSDSTAPLFNSSIYWHLFAQHGYPIPYIPNSVGMTSYDVGAIWKDQLEREFSIGRVTEDSIYLIPKIYKDSNGNDTRDWKTPSSPSITDMIHISGGVYINNFSVEKTTSMQIEPIMKYSNRIFIIDGKEVTEPGTYYCAEFKVSESQIGYDPASIKVWFPSPDLDNANEMARFTWSYNFKGANCCVNTTIDIRTRVECQSYGATQQQTFFDKGDYKAMFVIPKAAARDGIELDKPFNSPSSNSKGYTFYRTSSSLKDINDPIDRLIAYLHNPADNSYLFGMAAGLSLVSGDTITAKRISEMPLGNKNPHYRVGSISPSNTNKFYIAAVNTAQFENDYYHFPTTYFKEINYYVSCFDPAKNEGQVYWYKDGSNYVIYMHCQTEQNKLAINLPDFMEGLKVEIVEKTEGSTLLTDVIQNGKLYVNYDGEANYIVVKTV